MNISRKMEEKWVVFNEYGFVVILEESPYSLIFLIKIHHITGYEATHKFSNGILCVLFDLEMEVIGHKSKSE